MSPSLLHLVSFLLPPPLVLSVCPRAGWEMTTLEIHSLSAPMKMRGMLPAMGCGPESVIIGRVNKMQIPGYIKSKSEQLCIA